MSASSEARAMLERVTELKNEVNSGAVNERSRVMAKIVGVWLEACKMQLDYQRLRAKDEIPELSFFEGEAVDNDDVETIEWIETLHREIEQRLSSH